MICRKCGAKLDEDSVFCTECGEKVQIKETSNKKLEEIVKIELESSSPKINKDVKILLVFILVVSCVVVILAAAMQLDIINFSEQDAQTDWESSYEEQQNNKEVFKTTVKNIGGSFTSKDDIINYNYTQFEAHKEQLNNHDLSGFDTYGEYAKARTYLISGLEYITKKDYENAWSDILQADNAVWHLDYMGGAYTEYLGLDGLIDLLYDLKD